MTVYISDKVEIREGRTGQSIFAREDIAPKELIFVFDGELRPEPDEYSLQVGAREHLHKRGAIHESLNHSCEPNAYIDFGPLHLKALRAITAGEEVTLNYMTAELEMFSAFACGCGAPDCYGQIRGFKYLTPEQQRKLAPNLSPYLRGALPPWPRHRGTGFQPVK